MALKQLTDIPIEQRRHLYVYICASRDLNISLECAAELAALRSEKYGASNNWHLLYERLVINYARSFKASEPKQLKKFWMEFSKTWGDDDNEFHKHLINQRDKQFAHGDLTNRKVFVVGPGIQVPNFEGKVSKPRFAVRSDYFDQPSIGKVHQYIAQLLNGVIEASQKLRGEMFEGVDFPDHEIDLLT